MNLTAILGDLYRRLNFTAAPPSITVTRLTAFINETQRELLTLPGLERLRDDVLPVTAYANTARTGLPYTVSRIHAITDRANNHSLEQVPLKVLRMNDPAQAFTGGYPLRYASIGNQAVILQPATTGLWVVSSSASDTAQKAYVESITTGGLPNQPITGGSTLNGLTRVQIGARTDHIQVTKFYVDAGGVGFISLYDAAVAGNELAKLPIGQTFSRYWAVEWFPIPTQDSTEYVDHERTIFDMVNGTDEPLLPVDFHYLLPIGARLKEYETSDDDRAAQARALYLQGQNALRSFVLDDGDRIVSLRPTPIRWNRLGAQFPAGGN